MKKTITICSLILGVFCLGCSKDSTTAPTVDRFTISIAENEKGIVDPHGDFNVARADSLNIKAKNSREGYRFHKWQITNGSNNISVRDTAGDSTYVADIAGDAEIEAVFEKCVFDVIVTSDTAGDAANEGIRKIAYLDSTQITVQSALSGWEFSHWSIDNESNATIRDETSPTTWIKDVSGAVTVRAIFMRVNYDLTINQPAGGTITLINGQTPEITYPYGTVLRLKANPGRGYYQESWKDDVAGYDPIPDITITINGPTTIGAYFEEIEVPDDVICVDTRSTFNGVNKGSSWAKAYRDIEVADSVYMVSDGKKSLWIAKGEYPVSRRLEAKNGSLIIGGFSGYESMVDERDLSKNMTVINGQGIDRILNLYQRSEVTIDGIVFENAGTYAIYMSGSDGRNNNVANCVFRRNGENNATCHALRINVPNVQVKNCVFRENLGISGVAIRISKGNCVITNSIIYDNQSNAILDVNNNSEERTFLYNCTIYGNGNSTINLPGGISTYGNLSMYGVILYGNESVSGTFGTQINKINTSVGCCIQNPVVGEGVGEIVYGAVLSEIVSISPSFSEDVTSDDSKWFDSGTNYHDGILLPGNEDLWAHADYTTSKPSHDIRNVPRGNGGFTVGAIEKPD